jgi:hypothetical protein
LERESLFTHSDEILEEFITSELLFEIFGTGLLIENILKVGLEIDFELE